MIWWLLRGARPSPIRERELDQLRNEAVLAWIRPDPVEANLATFLASVDDTDRKEVERSARRLFKAFEKLLARSRDGLPLEEILPRVEQQLRADFPWMSSEAFNCLDSYIHWMNWHG